MSSMPEKHSSDSLAPQTTVSSAPVSSACFQQNPFPRTLWSSQAQACFFACSKSLLQKLPRHSVALKHHHYLRYSPLPTLPFLSHSPKNLTCTTHFRNST